MTIPVLLAFAEIMFALAMIVKVLTHYYRSTVHLLFVGMLLCLVIWLFGAAMGYSSSDYTVVIRWCKISSFGFLFLPAFTLHFTLVYSGRNPRGRAPKVLIYLPSAIFFAISLMRMVVFLDFIKVDGIWMGIPAYGDPVFYLIIAHYSCYYLIVFILLFRRIRMISGTYEKRQGMIIFASILITAILFNIEPFIIPALLDRPAFVFAPLFSIVWMAGIWIALRYYRLLGVYPVHLFEQMLSQITDIVIFIDFEFHVIFANESAVRRFMPDVRPGPAANLLLDDFIACDLVTRGKLSTFISSGLETGSVLSYFGIDEDKHLWRCRLTRLHDRFNDYYGVLMIIQNLASGKALKKKFGLSEREMEVVALVVDDRSNQEVAGVLNITIRTVKAHLTHIYMKTRTKNRVDLVNLVYGQE